MDHKFHHKNNRIILAELKEKPYSLCPKIVAHLEFKICPTKSAILTKLLQKTRVSEDFLQKRQNII